MKLLKPALKIENLNQLKVLVDNKRAVYSNFGMLRKPLPAAFVMNLQGYLILRLFERGMYLYESKRKRGIA